MINSRYLYLLPLLISLLFLVQLIRGNSRKLKLKSLAMLQQKGWWGKIACVIEKHLTPAKKTAVYSFYENLLSYRKLTVGEFFTIKILLVLVTALMIFLINLTNVYIYTSEILTKYDFYGDELYRSNKTPVDKMKALEEEIFYLREALIHISEKESKLLSKGEVQERILQLMAESEAELQMPPSTIANKVYYRLYHYYLVRSTNYFNIMLYMFLFYFTPDLILIVHNYFHRGEVRRELRFLKRLIILNGSIKPVSFLEVLDILIDKSKYHRKFLKEIESQNKKNSISNSSIYRKCIEKEKDINVKLFLEKLDQANNYDFDQAIINIENEFNVEKRQRIRNVKRQIEVINAWGIVGCFLLIGLLTIYMLIPWMSAYDMNQMF